MAKVTPTYNAGVDGDDFVPSTFEELGDMIGKVAKQIIRENTTENHLSVFDKGFVENGDTIEEAVVELAESQAYDSDGAHTLDRETSAKFAVKYFKSWTPKVFKKTLDYSELRKVLLKENAVAEKATMVISSTTEGDKQEQYENIRDLMKWGRAVADGGTGAVLVNAETVAYDTTNSSIDYKGVLVAMKNAVSGMSFVNASYNSASLKRRTRKEDIVILMPYQLKNKLDVDDLAGVFNLDKAEIKDRIIEIDSGNESGYYYVYVVDKNAVLDFTRLYEMLTQLNAEGRFWNYYLHTDRLYGLSALFDACYIKIANTAPGA